MPLTFQVVILRGRGMVTLCHSPRSLSGIGIAGTLVDAQSVRRRDDNRPIGNMCAVDTLLTARIEDRDDVAVVGFVNADEASTSKQMTRQSAEDRHLSSLDCP